MVRHSKRSLSPFSRDILFTSIYESCKHRASAIADASALTQTIIGQLREYLAEGVLERDIISTVAAATLERYDPTAAAVYGAYHPATTK
jgi:transcriptional regulator NrdR family protein